MTEQGLEGRQERVVHEPGWPGRDGRCGRCRRRECWGLLDEEGVKRLQGGGHIVVECVLGAFPLILLEMAAARGVLEGGDGLREGPLPSCAVLLVVPALGLQSGEVGVVLLLVLGECRLDVVPGVVLDGCLARAGAAGLLVGGVAILLRYRGRFGWADRGN